MSPARSSSIEGPADSVASSSTSKDASPTTMTSTATSISVYQSQAGQDYTVQSTAATHRNQRDSFRNSGYFIGVERNIDAGEFLQKHLTAQDIMLGSYDDNSKRRSRYYEEQFQYKQIANGSIRDRVQQESPVIAELRTNVIIKDEFTLVTELSCHLAARYTRPDSAIMVQVNHSACLSFGSSFDPCYILTLQAVPAQMGPTTNKRNAALIQAFMSDVLSVPAERGIIKFQPIMEENLAQGGTTMLGDIERREKQHAIEHGHPVKKAITAATRKSLPSMKKASERLSGDDKEATLPCKDIKSSSTKAKNILSTEFSNHKRHSIDVPMTATILSPSDIYELPTVEVERKIAPSIHNIQRSSSIANGLRMNPVSPSDSIQRPRTIGESSFTANNRRSMSEPLLSAAAPAPPEIRKTPSNIRPHSFLKTDPAATTGEVVSDYLRPKTSDGTRSASPAPSFVASPRGKSEDRSRTKERERLSDRFIRPKTAHDLRASKVFPNRPLPAVPTPSDISNATGVQHATGTTTLKAFGTTWTTVEHPSQNRGLTAKSHTSVRVPGATKTSKSSSLRSTTNGFLSSTNEGPGSGSDSSTANTAKRRSTMTATPAIPEDHAVTGGYGNGYGSSMPTETKSLKEGRGWKRKSFMAAFRMKPIKSG